MENKLIIKSSIQDLLPLINYLKNHTNCQFKQLVDIIAIDYPSNKNRFELNYELLSVSLNKRITIKLETNEITQVPSLIEYYNSANWYEREVYDLFGIIFKNHPDLRRILTDYGFEGYPLRKDYPLTGYSEVRYDDELKRIVYEPLELSQEFRVYNYKNQWEK